MRRTLATAAVAAVAVAAASCGGPTAAQRDAADTSYCLLLRHDIRSAATTHQLLAALPRPAAAASREIRSDASRLARALHGGAGALSGRLTDDMVAFAAPCSRAGVTLVVSSGSSG